MGNLHKIFIITVFLQFCLLLEGRLKCAKSPCKWFGLCGNGGSNGCPDNYEFMHFYQCLDANTNKTTGEKLYHCCSESLDQSGPRPPYLTLEDRINSENFPPVISDGDVPMPASPQKGRRGGNKNALTKDNRWPGAQIPYTLDSTFSDVDRAEVYRAIQNYQDNTCLRFYPKRSGVDTNGMELDQSYISIQGSDDSDTELTCGHSELCGPNGNGQFSKFGSRCRNAEWMIHELGHSLCLFHEQDRYDRDTYIYFDTRLPNCRPSDKVNEQTATTFELPFDWYSSQMYRGCTPGACIQRQPGQGTGRCGNNWNGTGRLTETDIRKFNRLYDCDCRFYLC